MGAQLWLSCGPISVSVAHLERDVVANNFFLHSGVSIDCKLMAPFLLGYRSTESDLVAQLFSEGGLRV